MKENKTNLIAQLAGWIMLAVTVLLAGHDARAQVVYDNSANVVTNGSGAPVVFQDAVEFGDEVVLSPGAGNANAVVVPGVSTNVVLTSFEYEYYAGETTYTATSNKTTHIVTTNYTYPKWTVDLRFYANDGAAYGLNYKAPGTLLYDSGVQNFTGSADAGRHTLTYSLANGMFKNGGVLVPLDFTWTVTFGGAALYSTNTFGLDMYTSPVVGSDFPDFWDKSGVAGAWVESTNNSGSAIDFGAVASSVGADAKLPTVVISSPANKAVTINNPTITVSGTAKLVSKIANNHLAQVQWRLNGGAWSSASLTTGTGGATNWSASVTLPTDFGTVNYLGGINSVGTTNLVEVQAFDAADNASIIASRMYVFVSEQPVNVVINGSGTVKYGSTTLSTGPTVPLQIGKTYTFSATQPSGSSPAYYFSNFVYAYTSADGLSTVSGNTGSSFGKTANTAKYTFTMTTNETITVNFVPNQFTAAAGTYNGLFYDVTNGVDMNSAGYFTLTVNGDADRSFSGKLSFAQTADVKISGTFQLDGTATAVVGTTNINFVLPLDTTNSTVTGSVVDPTISLYSALLGDKQVPAQISAFAGKYTLALPGNHNSTDPEGDATASLIVDGTKGTATLGNINCGSGAAAQLVPVISTNGDIPVFVRANKVTGDTLYNGLVLGWLNINPTTTDKLAGTLMWQHGNPTLTHPVSGLDSLQDSFAQQGAIIASPFTTPSVGAPVITFATGPNNAVFSLDGASFSVPITNTTAGGIYPITNLVVKNYTTNKTTHVITTNFMNGPIDYSLVVSVVPAKLDVDGHISGTFTNATYDAGNTAMKYTFNGVVLQNQGVVRGGFVGGTAGSYHYGYLLMH